MDHVFDVAIIGGGINGCGCAADAALRGLSVVLFEQDDLASKTSSSSTKLIHGGLRYLEHYEFGLVKKALEERQRLLTLAPHLVHPQSFILPYQKYMRPAWLLRLGLFFYDHLSRKNSLPKCKSIQKSIKNTYFKPLNDNFTRGFLFYDAATDDSRLTIVNALQAKDHGASIRTRSTIIDAQAKDKLWELTVKPEKGAIYKIRAKSIVNAAGPWVESITAMTSTHVKQKISLVKGSHIIVPALYEGTHAYFLQHEDKRVIFVIPYHGYSMIGTTDIPFTHASDKIQISNEEMDYLITLTNQYFKTKLSQKDIVHTWSGIRPLLAEQGTEAKALSRDYTYEFAQKPAPIITIFGGKITTYRQLAEEIVNQLGSIFPQLPDSLSKTTPLPGAIYKNMTFDLYKSYAKDKYHWLPEELLNRYLYSYGSIMEVFLSACHDIKSMGIDFGSGLYQVEVDYLIAHEWALTCEDILNRRTKLRLSIDSTGQYKLAEYLGKVTLYPLPQFVPEFH
ncbi:MAG TPA: glycerol-3-phosphate dehydrogenase [Legionella sp.]|nr:glycerol-3-phosphate dehydrogenase [Legionella sp.]